MPTKLVNWIFFCVLWLELKLVDRHGASVVGCCSFQFGGMLRLLDMTFECYGQWMFVGLIWFFMEEMVILEKITNELFFGMMILEM